MFSKKNIFISHSSKNKEIAEQLCSFITRFGIKEKQIFCSSVIGQGVGNGEKLNDAIYNAIHKSNLLIYLLSNDFLNSSYCIEELGVGWYLSQKKKACCFYLVLPDMDLSELKGFVNSKINKFSFIDTEHKDDLGIFAIDMAKQLKLKTPEHQTIVNASKTFFSTTETLLSKIVETRDTMKKAEIQRKKEVADLKIELNRKDESIEKLKQDTLTNQKELETKLKIKEFETICRHFQHLGFLEGITKREFEMFSKDFWFDMVNRYTELENLPTYHNYNMEMLLATIYSANGNLEQAYERLKKYVERVNTGVYPSFYENVIIEDTNDMQEIIDILNKKLTKEPQGIVYDSYIETINHLEKRKNKIAAKECTV